MVRLEYNRTISSIECHDVSIATPPGLCSFKTAGEFYNAIDRQMGSGVLKEKMITLNACVLSYYDGTEWRPWYTINCEPQPRCPGFGVYCDIGDCHCEELEL